MEDGMVSVSITALMEFSGKSVDDSARLLIDRSPLGTPVFLVWEAFCMRWGVSEGPVGFVWYPNSKSGNKKTDRANIKIPKTITMRSGRDVDLIDKGFLPVKSVRRT